MDKGGKNAYFLGKKQREKGISLSIDTKLN
jgi:hypothetical protein